MHIVLRVGKAIVVAAVAFWAARAITGSVTVAWFVCLIPLVFGVLDILAGLAYSLSAILFFIAIAMQVFSVDDVRTAVQKDVPNFIESIKEKVFSVDDVRTAVQKDVPNFIESIKEKGFNPFPRSPFAKEPELAKKP